MRYIVKWNSAYTGVKGRTGTMSQESARRKMSEMALAAPNHVMFEVSEAPRFPAFYFNTDESRIYIGTPAKLADFAAEHGGLKFLSIRKEGDAKTILDTFPVYSLIGAGIPLADNFSGDAWCYIIDLSIQRRQSIKWEFPPVSQSAGEELTRQIQNINRYAE